MPIVIFDKQSTISNPTGLVKLPSVIGLPPVTEGLQQTYNMMKNAMPHAVVVPCEPSPNNAGLTLFHLTSALTKYKSLLASFGYSMSDTRGLRLAFMAESMPTETLTNDYGESFLNAMVQGVSTGAGELNQIMGTRTGTDAAKKLSGMVGEATKDSKMLSGLHAMIESAGTKADKGLTALKSSSNASIKRMGNLIDAVLGGARADFPMVWKGSGFNQSYSLTVRLYNPNPGNPKTTEKYIIGPIAAILALATPQTSDKNNDTFNYPFFCKLDCKGMFKIDCGVLTSVTIAKGSEAQSIGWNQKLGMVDLRLEFMGLFRTIVTSGHDSNRPTIKGYIENLREEMVPLEIYDKDDYKSENTEFSTMTFSEAENYYNQENVIQSVTNPTSDPDTPAVDRTNASKAELEQTLESGVPADLSNRPTESQSSSEPVQPSIVGEMSEATKTAQETKAELNKAKETTLKEAESAAQQVKDLQGKKDMLNFPSNSFPADASKMTTADPLKYPTTIQESRRQRFLEVVANNAKKVAKVP